jgi:uncharacterized phiE125 gp8 family phage protein
VNYNLTLYTAPTVEPLSLSEVKDYLKLPTGSGYNGITTTQSLTPTNRVAGTYTGTAVEVLGYTASLIVNTGTVAGTLTVKVQESDNGSDWTDVTTLTAITSSNDDAVHSYDYTGNKRYIRGYATVATAAADFGINITTATGDTNEDAYITALIIAARKYCENYQNRAYITQTWELSFDDWACCCNGVIELPKGNLQSITSIKYTDSAGTVTTISSGDYVVSTRGMLGRVAPAYGKSWPSFTPYPLDAIVIQYSCGYGATSASVPETIKQAMYLLISHWYENRLPLADKMTVPDELNFTVSALLWQERIVVL